MAEDGFPDDGNEGTYGYCLSYDRLPFGTWLKLDWMEKDQLEGGTGDTHYKMGLSTRSGKIYQLWVSPRILVGLRQYRKLLEKERFQGKNIYFKYYGKKSEGSMAFHDFRLIIY